MGVIGLDRTLACVGVATAFAMVSCASEDREPNATTSASSGGIDSIGSLDGTTSDSGDSADGGESTDDGTTGSTRFDTPAGTTGTSGGDSGSTGDPCLDAAMATSNQGCEFWAVDLANVWDDPLATIDAAEDQQYAVVVANTSDDASATVTAYQGSGNTAVETATVAPGQIHTFRLPALNMQPRADSTGQAYRIESDLPVTAYQFNPLDNTVQVYSNDASILFPTPVLNNDYIAVSGDSITLCTANDLFGNCTSQDNSGAFVTVVATEDGTNVRMFPTKPTYSYPSGNTVPLNRGETFTIVSNDAFVGAGKGNLSGTRVTSDKPVAVFSGNVATVEPQPARGCCADHMEHQMLPLTAWGSAYAVAPAPTPNGQPNELTGYRITGAFDGTQLSYSPSTPAGAPTTINAGQTVRFESNVAFTVEASDPAKPFTVTQFLLSNQAIAGTLGQAGDPAMIVIPAAEQFQDRYIFLVPDGYTSNYVTIYRPTGANVALDGQDVSGGTWQPLGVLGGVAWQFRVFPVTVGSHTVQGDVDATLGIISVGYSTDVSYGYPGGSGVAVISEPPPPPAG